MRNVGIIYVIEALNGSKGREYWEPVEAPNDNFEYCAGFLSRAEAYRAKDRLYYERKDAFASWTRKHLRVQLYMRAER